MSPQQLDVGALLEDGAVRVLLDAHREVDAGQPSSFVLDDDGVHALCTVIAEARDRQLAAGRPRIARLAPDLGPTGLDRNHPHVGSEKVFTEREAEVRLIAAVELWSDAERGDAIEVLASELGLATCLDDLYAARRAGLRAPGTDA